MKVQITIDSDEHGEMSLGVTAEGADTLEVARMVLAGAELICQDHVRSEMLEHGASEKVASYAAPIRTRLFVIEQLLNLEMKPARWVQFGGD